MSCICKAFNIQQHQRGVGNGFAEDCFCVGLDGILQLLGSFIKIGPVSISLVLIPIVIGAAVYGLKTGAWLGLVFGIVVLLAGAAVAIVLVLKKRKKV